MINLQWLSALILGSSSATDAPDLDQPLIFHPRYIHQLMHQFFAVRELLVIQRLAIK